jgi:hypothetical protein
MNLISMAKSNLMLNIIQNVSPSSSYELNFLCLIFLPSMNMANVFPAHPKYLVIRHH